MLEKHPDMTWNEVCAKCEKSKEFQSDSKMAAQKRLELADTLENRQFHPGSDVFQSERVGHVTYVEVAVLTEAELLRIFKVGAKTLGFAKEKLVPFYNEEGKLSHGYYVGLCRSKFFYFRMIDAHASSISSSHQQVLDPRLLFFLSEEGYAYF